MKAYYFLAIGAAIVASSCASGPSRSLLPYAALQSAAQNSSCENPSSVNHVVTDDEPEITARQRASKVWSLGYGFPNRKNIRGLSDAEYASFSTQSCGGHIYKYDVTLPEFGEDLTLYVKHIAKKAKPADIQRRNGLHRSGYISSGNSLGRFVELDAVKEYDGELTGSQIVESMSWQNTLSIGGYAGHSTPRSYDSLQDCVQDIRTNAAEDNRLAENEVIGVCVFDNYPKEANKFLVYSSKLKFKHSPYLR